MRTRAQRQDDSPNQGNAETGSHDEAQKQEAFRKKAEEAARARQQLRRQRMLRRITASLTMCAFAVQEAVTAQGLQCMCSF